MLQLHVRRFFCTNPGCLRKTFSERLGVAIRLIGDRRICTTGYFSMVALDQAGQPVPVPRLLLEDEESRAEWSVGEEVRRAIDARRT